MAAPSRPPVDSTNCGRSYLNVSAGRGAPGRSSEPLKSSLAPAERVPGSGLGDGYGSCGDISRIARVRGRRRSHMGLAIALLVCAVCEGVGEAGEPRTRLRLRG